MVRPQKKTHPPYSHLETNVASFTQRPWVTEVAPLRPTKPPDCTTGLETRETELEQQAEMFPQMKKPRPFQSLHDLSHVCLCHVANTGTARKPRIPIKQTLVRFKVFLDTKMQSEAPWGARGWEKWAKGIRWGSTGDSGSTNEYRPPPPPCEVPGSPLLGMAGAGGAQGRDREHSYCNTREWLKSLKSESSYSGVPVPSPLSLSMRFRSAGFHQSDILGESRAPGI